MPRLVVVGGGISGLAAAWAAADAARRGGVPLDVLVLEREWEVGGKARSIVDSGWLVEAGPSGFIRGSPEFDELIAAAGMMDSVVPATVAARKRFIFRAGRMREVRPSPVALARAGVLTVPGAVRLAAEAFVPRAAANGDESVWAFAARRVGREAADRLVAPMCLGIFAGDAKRLSLRSAFPRMAALERDHGGLVRGLVATRGRMRAGPLASFRDGMQSLPRALAAHGAFTVRRSAEARALRRTSDRWAVTVAGQGDVVADAVVLAVEPWMAAELLAPLHAKAADALARIACPPIAVVALGFGPAARARIPEGFGVLVSRGEGLRMLGNLWESSLYPDRGPARGVLVRAMFGGAVDRTIGTLPDDALLDLARREVGALYGLDCVPEFTHVVRIPRAIPQYECGHADRVRAVEESVATLPGLEVTGFGLRGVAFADAAADGVRTGRRIASTLANGGGSQAGRLPP